MRVGSAGNRREAASVVAGFTITELLVVMAVIGILAAIMFPVVIKAKEGAKTTQCLSNMKQLGGGLCMYLDDYASRFPAAVPWGSPTYWSKLGNQRTIQELLHPYVRNGMDKATDGTYPRLSVFCCPSDAGVPGKESVNGVPAGEVVWKYAGCSYEYYAANQVDWQSNAQPVVVWTALAPEIDGSDGVQRVGAPLGNVVSVTRKAVMGDMWYWHMGDQVPDGRLAYRNTLFADGHAQRVTGTDHEDARLQQLKRWHSLSEVTEE